MITGVREQLTSMLQTQPRKGGFTATLTVDASLSIFPDHFASGPILPGVCMIQAVLIAAANASGVKEFRLSSLKTAKMTAPVRPGDVVSIDGTLASLAEGKTMIRAKLTCRDQRCAEFSMTALPLPGGEGAGVRGETSTDGRRSLAKSALGGLLQSNPSDTARLPPEPSPLPSGEREPEGAQS